MPLVTWRLLAWFSSSKNAARNLRLLAWFSSSKNAARNLRLLAWFSSSKNAARNLAVTRGFGFAESRLFGRAQPFMPAWMAEHFLTSFILLS